jgi:hypothetical protein
MEKPSMTSGPSGTIFAHTSGMMPPVSAFRMQPLGAW